MKENYIYLIPAVFFLGVFICMIPCKTDLKERYSEYVKGIKKEIKISKIGKMIKRIINFRKKEILRRELSDSLAYIKNISVLGRGGSMSSIMLLEELSEFCPNLSKIYLDMAHSLSVNDKEKAKDALFNSIGDNYAKDIGVFLAGWEEIPQADLIGTIDAYREALRQERNTKIKKRDELISDIVYFPVVLNCMTVLMNFIYVAYFLEQKEALFLLFN